MRGFAISLVLLAMSIVPSPAMAQTTKPFARAKEVHEQVMHKGKDGYSCWGIAWAGNNDELYTAFIEKRHMPNPVFEQLPLEFWEALGIPLGYVNNPKDIRTDTVVLKSTDGGKNWQETGRAPVKAINAFCWASGSDGKILRVMTNDVYYFQPDNKTEMFCEGSSDGGTTWQRQGVVLPGYHCYPYRMKRLRDGTLVLVSPYFDAFGPGRPRAGRLTKRAYVRQELTCGVFTSTDDGKTWSLPLTAFPSLWTWEPDFVELLSGDLLFVNSDMQDGPQVRQYFRKTPKGFIPGPVYDIASGRAPETLVYAKSGLLVGSLRGVGYMCSNDEAATWQMISDMPNCKYQPYMIELSDGRFLNVWHEGADMRVGDGQQWLGNHTFRLEANLPHPTQLTIERLMTPEKNQYVNAFEVTLTSGGKPLANKRVQVAWHVNSQSKKYHTGDYMKNDDPRVAGTREETTTDANGKAKIDLSKLEDHPPTIHCHYRVTAWFDPDDAMLTPSRSDVYSAYTVNARLDQVR
jgi:hypothetical protein